MWYKTGTCCAYGIRVPTSSTAHQNWIESNPIVGVVTVISSRVYGRGGLLEFGCSWDFILSDPSKHIEWEQKAANDWKKGEEASALI